MTHPRLIRGEGEMEIEVARDHEGEFEPQLARKRQTCPPGSDEKAIGMYSRRD